MGSGETRRKTGDSKEKDFLRSVLFDVINKAMPVFCLLDSSPSFSFEPSVYLDVPLVKRM